ncbi:hypothetical protein AB0M64_03730 [Streptomyces sp. NPDC051771]|uniref:hypothetical protein n=1 Tax=Streptomyces sp. NPDC051771 TaxID=3154847 RepID=UPI00341F0AE1
MPEVWIRLNTADRRRNWLWTGWFTLVCAGTAVAVALSETEEDGGWWVGGCAIVWLVGAVYMINRGYGRTLLTAQGMVFRTFFRRRSLPWSEVVRVERRSHATRSGEWWDVRVVRVGGRGLTVPGAFTSRRDDREFERKLVLIEDYLSRMSGRWPRERSIRDSALRRRKDCRYSAMR